MLTVQYRMHPAIRHFPSAQFYNDQLVDADFLTQGATAAFGQRAPGQAPSVPLVSMPYHTRPYFSPYVLFDVHGHERHVKTSVANDLEVRWVLDIFHRLRVEYPRYANADHVCVITPYKSQVRRSGSSLALYGWGPEVAF
jgi:senataxin